MVIIAVGACGGEEPSGDLACGDESIAFGDGADLSEVDALTNCVATLSSELDLAAGQVETSRTRIDELEGELLSAAAQAETDLKLVTDERDRYRDKVDEWRPVVNGIEQREQELEQRIADADAREDDLDARDAELDAREGELDQIEEEAAAKSFGDGVTWIGPEDDAPPGTYRTDGTGPDCYWQISPQGQPDDIIDNHFGDATGQSVTLSAGQQIESDGCGVWMLVE